MSLKNLEEIDKEKLEQRGKGKKYAILMAGLKLFGEYGVKGTSVRMIANEGNANIAAISYHFGTKENLYTEVVSYIGQQISGYMQKVKEPAEFMLKQGDLSKIDAMRILQLMMNNMATIILESDEPKAWAQVIMREQANPTENFDILYRSFIEPSQKMGGACIGAYMELDAKSSEVKIRFHALQGQILGFLISRESLLRSLGVKKLTCTHYNFIYKIISENIEACLNHTIDLSKKSITS